MHPTIIHILYFWKNMCFFVASYWFYYKFRHLGIYIFFQKNLFGNYIFFSFQKHLLGINIFFFSEKCIWQENEMGSLFLTHLTINDWFFLIFWFWVFGVNCFPLLNIFSGGWKITVGSHYSPQKTEKNKKNHREIQNISQRNSKYIREKSKKITE